MNLTRSEQELELVLLEFVQLGIMEVVSQSSDLSPGFGFTRIHMERVVSRDEHYIAYLKKEHNVDTTEQHIENFKKALKNSSIQKKLH